MNETLIADVSVLRKNILRIGEWNVRSLNQAGKVNNLMTEMERSKMDITGVSETRWTDSGMKEFDKFTLIFSKGQKTFKRSWYYDDKENGKSADGLFGNL